MKETMDFIRTGGADLSVLPDSVRAADVDEALNLPEQYDFHASMDMSELNGNEKYYYMSESPSTKAERPGQIKTGDLMLYGSDCIVLFYDMFSTPYTYTPVGYVENPDGLAQALSEEFRICMAH